MSKKILVIDDDPVIRTLITECLTCFGHTVHGLDNGRAGLEHLSREQPDLVILDFMMPGMSGLEVLKSIRNNPQIAKVPVVLLSANVDNKVLSEDPVQADRYLLKPFEIKDLIGVVESL